MAHISDLQTNYSASLIIILPFICVSVPSNLAVIASLNEVKALSYVLYMTFYHPLAKYPGPFVAKLSNVYSVWHAINGTRHSDLYKLHQKHGEVVRWGPNSVSVNSTSALNHIYGMKANVRKSTWYHAFNSISIFSAVDKDVHARKRRVMLHAFSEQAVHEIQPYILSVIRIWCATLGESLHRYPESSEKEWTSPRDMSVWSAYVIFDALGELLLGESFNTTLRWDNRFFLNLMASSARFINITGQMPILGRLNLSTFVSRSHKERRAKQFAFLRFNLRKRLALGSDSKGRRDIIHYLQQARDPETGQGYSEAELMGETALLLGAGENYEIVCFELDRSHKKTNDALHEGSDTANTALTSVFYFLVHNRQVLTRLTRSIRESFENVEDISSGHVLASNAYLKACVNEALRLCPPVPMLLPREVGPGGLYCMGLHFPEGTVIGVPTYALHHNESYFSNPFEYSPSRWLIEEEKEGKGKLSSPDENTCQREAFIPFSLGPRACIGRNVALFEIYVCLSRVLFMYDIRMQPGTEHLGVGPFGEYRIKDQFIVGKEGPVLQFRARSVKTDIAPS